MPETDKWLLAYGASHTEISNPVTYWLAVLFLVLATVGMLWGLPIPAEFAAISPLLNWGSAFLMAAVVYYFIISTALAIGMLPFVFAIVASQVWLSNSIYSETPVSAVLFVLCLAGLYAGRHKNGGINAVFEDIQMMMIAPIWLLANLYRRLGIPF